LPRYTDYHRTVIGFHGTKLSIAQKIVMGTKGFGPSENDGDWLGNGVYFWEYAPQQAFVWARDRKRKKRWTEEIAVVGSMIRLGNCFDLLDPENVKDLDTFHRRYAKLQVDMGEKLPKNVRSRKTLNCSVFNFAYATIDANESRTKIDTCRAVFVPSDRESDDKRLWKASGINRRAHVQICVRNLECILGTWLVQPMESS
jgi:hypothetical protein